jgi:hypothetical protein
MIRNYIKVTYYLRLNLKRAEILAGFGKTSGETLKGF